MATSKEYIEFVCEQLDGIENVTYRKMFGEYMVYVNAKPLLIVCDNTVMVKKAPELELRRFWHIKENQKIATTAPL